MPKEDVLGGVNALFYCLLSFRACLAITPPPLLEVFAFWPPPPPPPLVGHQLAAKVFAKENQWENGPPIKKLQLGQQVLPFEICSSENQPWDKNMMFYVGNNSNAIFAKRCRHPSPLTSPNPLVKHALPPMQWKLISCPAALEKIFRKSLHDHH